VVLELLQPTADSFDHRDEHPPLPRSSFEHALAVGISPREDDPPAGLLRRNDAVVPAPPMDYSIVLSMWADWPRPVDTIPRIVASNPRRLPCSRAIERYLIGGM
jgi:hypothetical protein